MKGVLVASAIVVSLSGCASVFNGTTQAVVVNSEPSGANATVTNRAGETVHSGSTPVTLTLKRGAGYFKSESYVITFAKTGFATKQVILTGTVSGWYIGNLLLGGLIGMVAVDPVTGAMYTFPESVKGTLEAESTKTSGAASTLTVVSTEALTPAQWKLARALAPADHAQ